MVKTIFHIDNDHLWNQLLNNLKNIIAELNNNNDTFKIKVLANVGSVHSYLNEELINRIKTFPNNVEFVACNNSLNSNNIDKNELNPIIKITSSGVYYLATKQNEGYSYIKV